MRQRQGRRSGREHDCADPRPRACGAGTALIVRANQQPDARCRDCCEDERGGRAAGCEEVRAAIVGKRPRAAAAAVQRAPCDDGDRERGGSRRAPQPDALIARAPEQRPDGCGASRDHHADDDLHLDRRRQQPEPQQRDGDRDGAGDEEVHDRDRHREPHGRLPLHGMEHAPRPSGMVQRFGVDDVRAERRQVKEQLIQLGEDAEDPGLQPRQIGPVQLVDMHRARTMNRIGARAFEPFGFVGLFSRIATVTAQLAPHEDGRDVGID